MHFKNQWPLENMHTHFNCMCIDRYIDIYQSYIHYNYMHIKIKIYKDIHTYNFLSEMQYQIIHNSIKYLDAQFQFQSKNTS